MRRNVAIPIIAFVALGSWWLWNRPALIGDGGHQLRIQFDDESIIQSVRCMKCGTMEQAERVAAAEQLVPAGAHNEWTTVIDPFDRKTFEISVYSSQYVNCFGYEYSDFQEKGLVVRIVLKDGRAIVRAIEIPDRRLKRDLTIKVS